MTPWASGKLFHLPENGQAFFTYVFKGIAARQKAGNLHYVPG